jgi:hypothetical protein
VTSHALNQASRVSDLEACAKVRIRVRAGESIIQRDGSGVGQGSGATTTALDRAGRSAPIPAIGSTDGEGSAPSLAEGGARDMATGTASGGFVADAHEIAAE